MAEVRTGLWHLEALGEGGTLKDTEHRIKEGNRGRRTTSSSGKVEFLGGGGEAFFGGWMAPGTKGLQTRNCSANGSLPWRSGQKGAAVWLLGHAVCSALSARERGQLCPRRRQDMKTAGII